MKKIRKILITVIGILLITVGTLLLVLPGPGLILIALGIIVLGSEYVWARRLTEKSKEYLSKRKRTKKN
ncbi:MAG: hypothetical protein JW995_13410 [Melioribacteraceae bacterium]|nr:hypothetical protein [Melioribacteraceae bacterium]